MDVDISIGETPVGNKKVAPRTTATWDCGVALLVVWMTEVEPLLLSSLSEPLLEPELPAPDEPAPWLAAAMRGWSARC